MQLGFIVALSRGLDPGEAARSVGKNRQNAYALRKRSGAESFAAAWDAVVAHVRKVRAEGRSPRPRPGGATLSGSPPRPCPNRPQGAEAIAERGAEAMSRASTPAAGRRAMDDMLDAPVRPEERQERQ
jgi:hypothetical protein